MPSPTRRLPAAGPPTPVTAARHTSEASTNPAGITGTEFIRRVLEDADENVRSLMTEE